MREVLLTLAVCLLLTVVMEESAALVVGVRKGFDLAVILFTNTLTNPIAVFSDMSLQAYTSIPRPVYVVIIELAVFITEALIYKKLLFTKKPSPLVLSLILNGVSFVAGMLVSEKILEFIL